MLVTTNIARRRPLFAHPAFAREAIDVLYRIQALWPFFLFAFVIMPDHGHLLLRVPEEGSVSKIINRFKMGVSHSIGLGPLWQPRFHLRICDDPVSAKEYIHMNPVRAGLVRLPEEYPWSSACGRWDIDDLIVM